MGAGDFVIRRSKEKFYALRTFVPFNMDDFVCGPQLLGISVPTNALSPILSIILFLSVIPIFRAADTLSENKMHSREVREYLDNVGKHYRKSENSE